MVTAWSALATFLQRQKKLPPSTSPVARPSTSPRPLYTECRKKIGGKELWLSLVNLWLSRKVSEESARWARFRDCISDLWPVPQPFSPCFDLVNSRLDGGSHQSHRLHHAPIERLDLSGRRRIHPASHSCTSSVLRICHSNRVSAKCSSQFCCFEPFLLFSFVGSTSRRCSSLIRAAPLFSLHSLYIVSVDIFSSM